MTSTIISMRSPTLLVVALAACLGCRPTSDVREAPPAGPRLNLQESGTEALLIGLDVLTSDDVWAAGVGGTFAYTVDGGTTWTTGRVPGADSLQFRDVHAFTADHVLLLSIGPGAASRIYRTEDRGVTWTEDFRNEVGDAFFDCFDFWADGAGLVFSDAVEGHFPIAITNDGRSWNLLAETDRPEALESEGGFAASGTCVVAAGEGTALIGTGNGERARVLRTEDRGRTWSASETPIVAGEAKGITTLAFRDARRGAALGGDLAGGRAEQAQRGRQTSTAVTDDGGRTWRAAAAPSFAGAVYGSTYVPGTDVLVAVGPGGAAFSMDDATSWSSIDTLSYWSVDAAGPSAVWAVGPDGRIARLDFGP